MASISIVWNTNPITYQCKNPLILANYEFHHTPGNVQFLRLFSAHSVPWFMLDMDLFFKKRHLDWTKQSFYWKTCPEKPVLKNHTPTSLLFHSLAASAVLSISHPSKCRCQTQKRKTKQTPGTPVSELTESTLTVKCKLHSRTHWHLPEILRMHSWRPKGRPIMCCRKITAAVKSQVLP